jgi:hypothetical protein
MNVKKGDRLADTSELENAIADYLVHNRSSGSLGANSYAIFSVMVSFLNARDDVAKFPKTCAIAI